MVTENVVQENKKVEEFGKICLVTDQDSLFENLKKYRQFRTVHVKHRLADIIGERECQLYIIDTRVDDMNIWPAPLLTDSDSYSKCWLFLVSRLSDIFSLQNFPTNAKFFDREHLKIDDLVSFVKTKSNPELGKRITEVNYYGNLRSFFIRMENGKMYNLKIAVLTEADSSKVTEWSIGEERNYIRVTQESGNWFEIPWDDILYHCEPEYEYFKGNQEQDSNESLKKIGERVRDLRKARGFSVNDLAVKAGMKRPNLSRLEHGKHQPSLETIERIAEALNTSVAEVIGRQHGKSLTGGKENK